MYYVALYTPKHIFSGLSAYILNSKLLVLLEINVSTNDIHNQKVKYTGCPQMNVINHFNFYIHYSSWANTINSIRFK